ncbi:flavin reductase family protein [Streptomyces sp. NPDC097981]|uniref:flavin reductase family protein n=1 Tax=Streptomyces sp. NPDC097981 TaxID=3155428 RepID=UPI00332FF34A
MRSTSSAAAAGSGCRSALLSEGIERMQRESGGFGTLLVNTQDWATREQTKRSYEMLARYVAPHFTGALDSRRASQKWVSENKDGFAADHDLLVGRVLEVRLAGSGRPLLWYQRAFRTAT